jgi:MFS family permease
MKTIITDRKTKLLPWLIWALASSFVFYKYILEVSPSVMAQELMSAFHLTGAELGNLAACYFYAYLIMQLPVGILLDRFTARNIITCAILVCAFSTAIFSYTTELNVAYCTRILLGLFGAFSAVGTMKLVTLWFPAKRFALLSGLMMTIAMLGAVVGQGPLAVSVDFMGWRKTLLILAIIGIGLAILFYILSAKKNSQKISQKKTLIEVLQGVKTIAKSPYSWLIALYSGLAFAPISAFAGLWGIPFLTETYHMPKAHIAEIVSLTFIGFAIGAPLSGWYSNHIGKRKMVMLVGTVLALICLCVCLYVRLSIINLSMLMFIMGFFISFFFISFAYINELNPHRFAGSSIGFINMFNALCGAISDPLIGKLLDLDWDGKMQAGARYFTTSNYQHALIILPIGVALAIIFLLFCKETHCQQA